MGTAQVERVIAPEGEVLEGKEHSNCEVWVAPVPQKVFVGGIDGYFVNALSNQIVEQRKKNRHHIDTDVLPYVGNGDDVQGCNSP